MSKLGGQWWAMGILGLVALVMLIWALWDRLRSGQWGIAAKVRLRVALIFVLVCAWLLWSHDFR